MYLNDTTTKTCSKCGRLKSSDFFYKRKTGKLDSWCRECNSKASNNWRNKNRKKHNKSSRDWAKNNPDHKRNTRYLYAYGITLEQYNNILNKQNECCAICVRHKSAFKRNFAVDHCHLTKKVRGLLCEECNKGIGHFKDSRIRLTNAVLYLKAYK